MRILLAVAALTLAAGSAIAADSNLGPPPATFTTPPPRARGIDATLAAEGALEAISVCLKNGYKVTALITDAAAVPIVLISGNDASSLTQLIANGKAQSVIKYKMSSGQVADKAAADPAFKAELAADPLILTGRQGAIPIMAGGTQVGAFAVSGAPGGDKDEVCAKAGLAKIQARIK